MAISIFQLLALTGDDRLLCGEAVRRRAKVEAESEAPPGTLEGSTPSITPRAISNHTFFSYLSMFHTSSAHP